MSACDWLNLLLTRRSCPITICIKKRYKRSVSSLDPASLETSTSRRRESALLNCAFRVRVFSYLFITKTSNLPLPILLIASNCNVFVLLRRSTETNSCPVYLSPGLLSSANPIWLVPKQSQTRRWTHFNCLTNQRFWEIRWSTWWNSDHFCTKTLSDVTSLIDIITSFDSRGLLSRCWLLHSLKVRYHYFHHKWNLERIHREKKSSQWRSI